MFGGKDTKVVLQSLDRLTQSEACATASQILEVIHSLVQNFRVVMDGEQAKLVVIRCLLNTFTLDGEASIDSVREALVRCASTRRLRA